MEQLQWNSVKTWEKQNIIVVQPHLKLAAWSCVSRSGSSCSKLDTERTWAAASVPKHFKWMALFAMLKKTYLHTQKHPKTQLQSSGCRFPDRKVRKRRAKHVQWISRCTCCNFHSVPSPRPLRTQLPICRDSRFCSLKAWLDTRNLDFVCVTQARQTFPICSIDNSCQVAVTSYRP